MVFVSFKILYLSHQTISLGNLQSICLYQVLPVLAEAGDKVSVKDLCLAFSTEIMIYSLFSLFFLIFLC